MADKAKVYGLILPKKKPEQTKTKPAQKAFNVFGNESDEDNKPDVNVSLFSKNAVSSKVKRQTQVDIDTALLEDPNVYEYDNIYDEMQASKAKVGVKEKEKSNTEKQPKYILGLLKAAEQKKKEDERRKERKVQKEREAEGEEFADKEKFVTTAYKQKMLSMQEEEEKEKREAAFEAMTDVTKQKDMSGFYRYLYRQTAGNDVTSAGEDGSNLKEEKAESIEIKTELESSPKQKPQTSSTTSSEESSSSEGVDSEAEAAVPKEKAEFFKSNHPKAGSNFRKRRANSSSPESDTGKSKASKKKPQRSLSKSVSPQRKRRDRDYSRRESTMVDSSRKQKSQPHSSSPESNRRRIERSRSRERLSKDQRSQSGINQRSGSREKSRRSRSREKSRRSSSREQSRRSRSREKSRRSRSREKTRRSRSREKSRRSWSREKSRKSKEKSRRSRDKYKKVQTKKDERAEHSRSHSAERKRKEITSRSPSSDGSHGKGQGLRTKSTDEEKKLQRSGKTKIKEKDKVGEKCHADRNDRNDTTQSEVNGDNVGAALRMIRDNIEKADGVKSLALLEKSAKPVPVDPAKKFFPHHNSPQDIIEAKKRYLQRKAIREG